MHRLVATAFIHNPNHLPQVNHKDENKKNNYVSNLEWCDHKYNINYGTTKQRIGFANRNNSFWSKKVEQLTQDGIVVGVFPCAGEAERVTGIDQSSIRKVCRNKPKHITAGGYVWRNII